MQKRNTSTQNDYMVCLEGSTPPHKKVPPLFFDLPYDEFKTPSPHLFAPPSPINMTTMQRHHAQFSPTCR